LNLYQYSEIGPAYEEHSAHEGVAFGEEGNHKKGPDFILAHSMQDVDIKAANKPFHKRILIREDQFQAHIHDIYIGAKYIDDNSIEYHGYINGEEVKKLAVEDFGYGPCRALLLEQLKPINQFIELCIRGVCIK
jgi:hypothetical protein